MISQYELIRAAVKLPAALQGTPGAVARVTPLLGVLCMNTHTHTHTQHTHTQHMQYMLAHTSAVEVHVMKFGRCVVHRTTTSISGCADL